MGFVVGALEALANVFDIIFERLNELGDKAKTLEGDFEKLTLSLEEAATHAAQYAVEVKFEDLDLESNLSRAESLQGDVESLKFSVHELENDMHLVRCQDARVDSLERDIEGLKGDTLSRDSARVDALESDVKRLEHSARHMEYDRIDSLEREVNALTDLVRGQGEVIKALLKALEWEPPKD